VVLWNAADGQKFVHTMRAVVENLPVASRSVRTANGLSRQESWSRPAPRKESGSGTPPLAKSSVRSEVMSTASSALRLVPTAKSWPRQVLKRGRSSSGISLLRARYPRLNRRRIASGRSPLVRISRRWFPGVKTE
jgi:hypothetical protein